MPLMQVSRPLARKSAILAMAAALCLGGCTVGPDYHKPTAVAPADWTSWHSGSDALRPALADAAPLPPDWWQGFRDPVLDELERRAFTASPDLRTAALHFAQARVQRDVTASQGLPQVNATATVQGQRQSEFGASTRLFDEIGGANRDALAKLLGNPTRSTRAVSTLRGKSTSGARCDAASKRPMPTSPNRAPFSIRRG
jgi:outer membrane protein TolC